MDDTILAPQDLPDPVQMPPMPEPQTGELRDPPTDPTPLAQKWQDRLDKARRHYEKYFRRCAHNRAVVAGFNWRKDPSEDGFIKFRANLIQGTITALLPTIYSQDPEIEVRPSHGEKGKLFATTLEKVCNRMLSDAHLKTRAKGAVRAALTVSIGALKVCWQEQEPAPLPMAKIEDSTDNIDRIHALAGALSDPSNAANEDAIREELEQTSKAVEEQAEVSVASGIVVDRVMIDNLLVDPTIQNFEDYPNARWIAQAIPMRRCDAEGKFGWKLDRATKYRPYEMGGAGQLRSHLLTPPTGADEDDQIVVFEIWDKSTQRVYTLAQGCNFWLREPFSPEGVGERWYPFFLLPFQQVDGNFVGPSLVDLTERLQVEHNKARDDWNAYRELCKPGYIASSDVKPSAGKAFIDSQIGDLTFLDLDGDEIQKAIQPKSIPSVPTAIFDTSAVRNDWEMSTGVQDAQRSGVVKAKTATEAKILQNAQSGRVVEFTDSVEDWLSELAQYTCEMLLQHMDVDQVARIMGPEPYEWPQMLNKDDVFYLVDVMIRAGSTGKPDKIADQQVWGTLMPSVEALIKEIMSLGMQGMDVNPLIYLLTQTVNRFDDSLDIAALIPNLPMMQQQQALMQQQAMMQQAAAAQAAGGGEPHITTSAGPAPKAQPAPINNPEMYQP